MKRPAWSFVRQLAVVVLATALAACTDHSPSVSGINAAAGGGSGDPTVASTDPNNAPQDTTLDVVVSGAGFDKGSQAQWAIAGVPAAKIRTNSTRFVSSKQLVANITIALDADTVLYDVIVTTTTGKKGIGTELFLVRAKGRPALGPALSVVFADGAGDNVRSDGRGAYRDGDCGVQDNFNLGDLRLSPSGAWVGSLKRTCGSPRSIALEFDDPVDGVLSGTLTGTANFLSVDEAEAVTTDSGTVERKAQLNGTCNRLVFNPDEFPGTSRVLVTRTGSNTWTVVAPAGAVAWCVGRGKAYRMPFAINVTLLP